MQISLIEKDPLLLVVSSNDPNIQIYCSIYKQWSQTLRKLWLVSESSNIYKH